VVNVNSDQVRTACAIVSVVALSFIIFGTVLTMSWEAPATPPSNTDLGYAIFTSFGPTLIVVGALMFAAMLGGVFIAQEEKE
jgi:NADH:ubiquinone oxidoreductase subunit 6 (subunit J)